MLDKLSKIICIEGKSSQGYPGAVFQVAIDVYINTPKVAGNNSILKSLQIAAKNLVAGSALREVNNCGS